VLLLQDEKVICALKGGRITVLLMVKKLAFSILLFSALAIPTSASADTWSSYSTTQFNTQSWSNFSSQYNTQSLINLCLTLLGCKVGGTTSTSGGKQVSFSSWWSQHHNECPTQDSYQIWQQWYCGGSGGDRQHFENDCR
jgi:hypothetical protein